MASLSLLGAFLLTTLLFAVIPGPAMLYATAQTVASGRWSGLMAALGIHVGGYGHVIAAAAGLSTLLVAVPTLYFGVKFVGAAYLVGLGIALLRTRESDDRASGVVPERSVARRTFMHSVGVEVLNPKTAIFFLAFLPQFADPAGSLPVWLQLALLGAVVNLIFSAADIVCVLAADAILARLKQSRRTQRWLQRAGGGLLVGLGGHLALQQV